MGQATIINFIPIASGPPLEGLQRVLPARQLFSVVRVHSCWRGDRGETKTAWIAPGRSLGWREWSRTTDPHRVKVVLYP